MTSKRTSFLLTKLANALEPVVLGDLECIYDDDKEEIIMNFKDRFGNYHHANLYILNGLHFVYYHCDQYTKTIQTENFEEGLEMLSRMMLLAMRDNQSIRDILKKYKMISGEMPVIEKVIHQFF